ncbi:MAG: GNAT family N-acetyltransferase [Bacteroidota bacterium]
MEIQLLVASAEHVRYAPAICQLIETAAAQRGTGIAKRQVAYLAEKMREGKAIIALSDTQLAGFCYVETWAHEQYVANSGLIVAPQFQGRGLARRIKKAVLDLSRQRFPRAQIFGITTSAAVLKINYELGYRPVTFAELPQDEAFWRGCVSCPNYDILQRHQRRMCLCTGMLAPAQTSDPANTPSIIPTSIPQAHEK